MSWTQPNFCCPHPESIWKNMDLCLSLSFSPWQQLLFLFSHTFPADYSSLLILSPVKHLLGFSFPFVFLFCSFCGQRYNFWFYTSFMIVAQWRLLWGSKPHKNLWFLEHFSLESCGVLNKQEKKLSLWYGNVHCTF